MESTLFRVTLPDGSILSQDGLPGTILTLGDGSGAQRRIRIDAVQSDDRDPTGEVMLYTLSEPDPAAAEWRNAWQPDRTGDDWGSHSRARSRRTGGTSWSRVNIDHVHRRSRGDCSVGRQTLATLPDGTSLEPYYQACVRLVARVLRRWRGPYCNGTPIDLFDRIGIQQDETAPDMTLEAAFGPEGAVCVAHTRLSDVLSMQDLLLRYPRLASHPWADCTESSPALLFVRSAPDECSCGTMIVGRAASRLTVATSRHGRRRSTIHGFASFGTVSHRQARAGHRARSG